MKALSLWQPYASLIAAGVKPFETRDWAPPWHTIGKRIAIHAAKRRPKRDELTILESIGLDRVLGSGGPADLPYGAIVCTAVLRGAYQTAGWDHGNGARVGAVAGPTPPRDTIPTDAWGDYSPGRWCWHLVEIRRVALPVPIVGRQGLFEIDAALLPEGAR